MIKANGKIFRWTPTPAFRIIRKMMSFRASFFVSGIGSALEVYPLPVTITARRHCPDATDAQRLASDWYRVGWAINSAMDSLNPENAVGEDRKTHPT